MVSNWHTLHYNFVCNLQVMDFSEIIKRCTVAQCPILKNVPSNKYRMNLKEKNSITSFLLNQLRSDKFYKFFLLKAL